MSIKLASPHHQIANSTSQRPECKLTSPLYPVDCPNCPMPEIFSFVAQTYTRKRRWPVYIGCKIE